MAQCLDLDDVADRGAALPSDLRAGRRVSTDVADLLQNRLDGMSDEVGNLDDRGAAVARTPRAMDEAARQDRLLAALGLAPALDSFAS